MNFLNPFYQIFEVVKQENRVKKKNPQIGNIIIANSSQIFLSLLYAEKTLQKEVALSLLTVKLLGVNSVQGESAWKMFSMIV